MSETKLPLSHTAQRPVAHLLKYLRPLVIEAAGGNRRTCIQTTRLAVDYLRGRGVSAEPAALGINIANSALTAALFRARNDPTYTIPLDDQGLYAEGLANYGVGNPVPGELPQAGWDGHMVCVVEGSVLVDLSIDQFDGCHPDARFTPLVLPLPRVRRSRQLVPISTLHDGHICQYFRLPGRIIDQGVRLYRMPLMPFEQRALDELRRLDLPAVPRMSGASRNVPCHCGSGRKSKRCHGGSAPASALMATATPLSVMT
jgi:hypothetical protein